MTSDQVRIAASLLDSIKKLHEASQVVIHSIEVEIKTCAGSIGKNTTWLPLDPRMRELLEDAIESRITELYKQLTELGVSE